MQWIITIKTEVFGKGAILNKTQKLHKMTKKNCSLTYWVKTIGHTWYWLSLILKDLIITMSSIRIAPFNLFHQKCVFSWSDTDAKEFTGHDSMQTDTFEIKTWPRTVWDDLSIPDKTQCCHCQLSPTTDQIWEICCSLLDK